MTKTLATQSTKGWTVFHLQCIENDLIGLSFTIDITKVTNFFFGKIFQWRLFQFFEFSNYQTLIKAYINTPYKRNRNFQRNEKKFRWKENNSQNYRIQENVCLRRKFDLHLKKKTKNFWAKFSKYFCVAIKKMPVIQFPYMGIVW